MEPSFLQRLFTELRLAILDRRSELVVTAVALLIGSVFVTTRLLEAPTGLPSTAGGPTPTLPQLLTPTTAPQQITPAAFQGTGFGRLQLTPIKTPTLMLPTPTSSLLPTEPTVTPTPTLAPSPTEGPRLNPWAPYIP